MIRKLGNSLAAAAASLALAFVACASTPSPVRADTMADLRGGVYTDEGGFALGGGVIQRLRPAASWYFNPNLEAAFANGSDEVSLNADVHYDFPTATSYNFYAGAGPALIFDHPEGGNTQTNAGLNLVGGVNWHREALRPFVQMKGVLSDQGELALMGGVRF